MPQRNKATKEIVSRLPRTVGYLRVSTSDQDLEKNKADILAFANDRKIGPVEWVEEKVSGMKSWRNREIARAVNFLIPAIGLSWPNFPGWAVLPLIFWKILAELKRKGVNVYAIKGAWALNGTIESKVFLHLMSLFSEIERDLISQRTTEALRARKSPRG